jgi:hypothetical protein
MILSANAGGSAVGNFYKTGGLPVRCARDY